MVWLTVWHVVSCCDESSSAHAHDHACLAPTYKLEPMHIEPAHQGHGLSQAQLLQCWQVFAHGGIMNNWGGRGGGGGRKERGGRK